MKQLPRSWDAGANLIIGNRIPKDYFITKGRGESDITFHAGSYHLALKEARIESYNIMTYSSILPGVARLVKKPQSYTHGSVMETIMSVCNMVGGQRGTAGIIYGWLYDKKTKQKYGGLVCECSGNISQAETKHQLKASLNELYFNGYSVKYRLKDEKIMINSFTPKKKFGTVLVGLCFVNYLYPQV